MALTTNQNWFGSLFPTPLNTDNFIALTILTRDGNGGGMGEDGGENNETRVVWARVVCVESFALSN